MARPGVHHVKPYASSNGSHVVGRKEGRRVVRGQLPRTVTSYRRVLPLPHRDTPRSQPVRTDGGPDLLPRRGEPARQRGDTVGVRRC